MHRLLNDSELVWMSGVGHMPNLEREAEFNAALGTFLTSVFTRVQGTAA
jgi:pimeloyl-ACP methyl ester carboxylesterase